MKKLCSWLLIATLALSVLFTGSSTEAGAATISDAKLKSIYKKYVGLDIGTDAYMEQSATCYMYDFNKDGVKEFVASESAGARPLAHVYTYYKGKVKKLEVGQQAGYVKGKKYMVLLNSGSGFETYYDVYKISGGKVKKVTQYSIEYDKYKKDGKEISEKSLNNFTKKIKSDLGKGFKVSNSYLSAKQIGFKLSDTVSANEIQIDKVTKTKITYHTENWDWSEGVLLSKSKPKTVKITKDTKYYLGEPSLCYSVKNNDISDYDKRKWIKKISKAQFCKILKNKKNILHWIKIKNGKAELVALDLHFID